MNIYTFYSNSPDRFVVLPDGVADLGRIANEYDSVQWTHKGLTFALNKTMISTAVEVDRLVRKWPAFKAQRKPVVFPASSCREVK